MRGFLARPTTRFVALFLLLLLLRVPFYFTHHVQEDAYISLRCAENLAATGVYGFNPGVRVSASTAHLYVFLAALVGLVSGEVGFIPIIQVVNTLLFLVGTWFFSSVIAGERKNPHLLWVVISCIPISLLTSYSGMETSLLIFMVGLVFYMMFTGKHRWLTLPGLALLPWIRPDAIAFGLLLIFWDSIYHKKIQWAELSAIIFGSVGLLAFNQVYFGSLLQQSINAKLMMSHPFSVGRFLADLQTVFIGQAGGMFSPIRTRFFEPFGIIFVVVILGGMLFFFMRQRGDRTLFIAGFAVASMALAVPAGYAFGGVLYQWYFWPSAILGALFPIAVILMWLSEKGKRGWLLRIGMGMIISAGVIGQLAFSYAWGIKEFSYRGGIGIWLKDRAQTDDAIFLEPAGYIPFYSGLFTYDEVGLVSPQVVTYRQAYEPRWWPEFVMDFQPDWIIQRGHITRFETYQGYTLTEEEQEWFQSNYALKARFSFSPLDYTHNSILARMLALGEADDFYIFEKVN